MQTTNGGKGYSGTAGAMKNNPQYIPSGNSSNSSNNNNSSNSSENILSDPCYKNLSFTVKNYGYNKDGGFYSWGIKVRNGYSKAVQLKYKLIVGNDNSGYGTLTNFINPNSSYTNDFGTVSAIIVKSNSEQFRIEVSDVCFQGQDCIKNGYADCNGNQRTNTNDKLSSTNTNQTNNSNTSTTQQNDLTEYNNSKANLERQMQQRNQEIANSNAEAQRQQQLLKQQQEQQRQQQIQQGITQVSKATTDLITILSNRKRASKNALTQEDGQAILAIANSENPTDYANNIVDIFSDLGYTHKSTEKMSDGGLFISMYDNTTIQWPLSIFIHPASYDIYNRISFNYQKKEKLFIQLEVLKFELEGWTIKGITPSQSANLEIEAEKKREEERIKSLDNFEKNRSLFDVSRFYDFVDNTPITPKDIYAKNEKPTLFVTYADWCLHCVKDIDEIIKLGINKKVNVVPISLDSEEKKQVMFKWLMDRNSEYFNLFKMLIDKDKIIIGKYNIPFAPLFLMIDKNGNLLFRNRNFSQVNKIEDFLKQNKNFE